MQIAVVIMVILLIIERKGVTIIRGAKTITKEVRLPRNPREREMKTQQQIMMYFPSTVPTLNMLQRVFFFYGSFLLNLLLLIIRLLLTYIVSGD
jgi:hypothetical protein